MIDIANYKTKKKQLGLTFEDLSNMSGVPVQTLHNIFRGHTTTPRIDTVQAIERALGLAPTFTDEERALGAGQEKTTLSAEEWEWLELMEELKQKKGSTAVKVILDMIRAYIGE